MANSYIGDLTEDATPDIDSVIEIEELTDPLDPLSRKMKLRDLMTLVAANMSGHQDVNDLTTASTPLAGSTGVTYVVPNDGAGAFSLSSLPTGFSSMWVPGTNSFDLSQLAVGDEVEIRFDAEVTTTASNQDVRVYLELNQSPGTPFNTEFVNSSFKTAGVHPINKFNKVYVGSTDVRDNPAQFKIVSDAAFTLKVNGWAIFVTRRSI